MTTAAPARFLFTTWEGGGNIAPALTLARRLRQRGHHVRFMSEHASRSEAMAAGVEFVPWTTAPSRPDRTRANDILRDWESTNPQDGIARVLKHVLFGPALRYAQDLLAELKRQPTDLVISSEMLFGVMAACESTGQKLALLATNLCMFPLPGMPLFGPALAPPRNQAERALHAEIFAATVAMFDAGLGDLNAARQALGLPALAHATDQLAAAERYLLATSSTFDFPADNPPANLRYIGPLLDEPAWAQPWSSPWPDSDRRPLVVVAFSTTFQNHAGSLQAVIDAVATLPVRVLVTLAAIDLHEVRGAANVALATSAPHDALMRDAALVVTHGGHGTVMRALVHRRPMLILPHGRDQNENALRISERGAGITLPPNASAREIANAVQRLLSEPAYAQAAERLGSAVTDEMRQSTAIEDLETLAPRRSQSHHRAHRQLVLA